jgi:hypothetical protein
MKMQTGAQDFTGFTTQSGKPFAFCPRNENVKLVGSD